VFCEASHLSATGNAPVALIQCGECKQPVSDEATVCPQCGHILKEEKPKFWPAALTVFPIALSVLSVVVVILDHLSEENKQDVDIAKTYWEAVSDSKSPAKIILTLNYTKHLLQKNLVDPTLAIKTCLFLSDDENADSKVKHEAGETLYEIRTFQSVADLLAHDPKLNNDVTVHIVAFLPSVAAEETRQLLSKIPQNDSRDADLLRQNAKQTIEQASKLASGDESRAITGAGLSGVIENQAGRAKALAQASHLAQSDPNLRERTLNVLLEAFKTTENVSAKKQIQDAMNQIRDSAASSPAEQPTPAPSPAEQPTPASSPAEQPTPAPSPAEQPTPAPSPAEQPTPAPSPAEQPTPAPSPAEQPTPAPSPAEQPTPAPSPAEQPTPAPSPAEQPTPAPSPAEQPTPASASEVRKTQSVFSAVIVYPGQSRENEARLCKQKLEARGTPSRLDDTTKLEGLNPIIPSKLEVRYSDPRLKRQVENIVQECKSWLNLDGSTKLFSSRLVDTDTIEVWLPR
jgi:hypothetical protein